MTGLYELIKTYSATAAESGDWSTVADLLNSPSVNQRITELRSSRWLMQNFADDVSGQPGATEADLILGTLQAATVPRVLAAYAAMAGEGIDLSDPQVQGMIDVLGQVAGWPTNLTARLKAAGFDQRSPAEIAGLGPVTAEQCQASYAADQAVSAGEVEYDNRRILLCLNDGPVNDSLTIRYTPVGVVGGIEVSGPSTNSGGVSTNLTGRDKQLYTDLRAAVAKWEAS